MSRPHSDGNIETPYSMLPAQRALLIPIEEFPDSLERFMARFPDLAACRELAWAARHPHGFQCSHCGNERFFESRDHRGYRFYTCCNCKHKASLTAGTPMAHNRVPATIWCQAAFLYSVHREELGSTWLQKSLGLAGDHTAIDLLQRIRGAITVALQETPQGPTEIAQTKIVIGSKEQHSLAIRGTLAFFAGSEIQPSLQQPESGTLRLTPLHELSPESAASPPPLLASIFSDLEQDLSRRKHLEVERRNHLYWTQALEAYAFGYNAGWQPAVIFDHLLRALMAPHLIKKLN